MNKLSRGVLIVIGAVALLTLGGAAWFFGQGGAEPTTDVTAPAITTTAPAESTESRAPEPTDGPRDTPPSTSSTFELTDASTATFTIDEVLRGSPTTVVGTSGIVLGQIEIDRDDLSASRVGTILVNARDFSTDSSLRDRAVRGPILDADTFEFIEFAPTSIDGLSGTATTGDQLSFTVTGDLTIRGVTSEVTFDVVTTLVDDSTIEGSATTTVDRGDFDLTIPSVASVADVSEQVPLTLEFVATAA